MELTVRSRPRKGQRFDPPPPGLKGLGLRLGLVAWGADRLQVAVVFGAACGLRYDVIHLPGHRHPSCSQAGLAEASIARQDAIPRLDPGGSVAPIVPVAAVRIGKGAGLAVCLVRCTVARSIADKLPASRVTTGARSSYRHGLPKRKSPSSARCWALVAAMTCIETHSKPCMVCMSSIFIISNHAVASEGLIRRGLRL